MNFNIFILIQDDTDAKSIIMEIVFYNSAFCRLFFYLTLIFFFSVQSHECKVSANIPQDNLFLIMLMRLSSSIPQGDTSLHGEALNTLILFSSPILWSASETSNSSTCRWAVQPRVRSVITELDTSHPIKMGLLCFSLCMCARAHAFCLHEWHFLKNTYITKCVVNCFVLHKWTSSCTLLGIGG